jgi:hypothetical protein
VACRWRHLRNGAVVAVESRAVDNRWSAAPGIVPLRGTEGAVACWCCDCEGQREPWPVESAFIPFVSFGDLDNNTFKGLTSLLSVEQEIQYDEHT